MPPSTVFSYWRRDHRRSTAPPASLPVPAPASMGPSGSPIISIPQLPELPDTPTLIDAFEGTPSYNAPPWSDSPLESDTAKLNIQSSAAALSSISLGMPSPTIDKENRPHSSPEEHEHEPEPQLTLTSQPNSSQLSVTRVRPDQGDGESSPKPTSPFRLSFGKGLRNLQSPATENQKRSPSAGPGPGSSQLRMQSSPEELPTLKQTMPQRDPRVDAVAARRAGDRDVSTDHPHHKSGKAMLHLLNPMSLLARRRSSQITASRDEDGKLGKQNLVPAIPDDYDPRIRGNIIHDFSAPRPRRNVSGTPTTDVDGNTQSAQDSSALRTTQSPAGRWDDQNKRHSDHSPVFKEHFEEQNVLQVENKGYLQSSLLTSPAQPGYEKSIPVFARRLPSTLPEQSSEFVEHQAPGPIEKRSPEPVELPADPPRSSLPANQQQDQDIIPNLSHHPAGLPRHFKSNASRFSFDMGGVESSTQEKLLEEKHKAKEAARKMEDGYFDDFDDEFDHELLDDFDGLEEKIPGVNVDADDDEFEMSAAALKSWAPPGLSPVVASPVTPAPPEVPSGFTEPAQAAAEDQAHFSTEKNNTTSLYPSPSAQQPPTTTLPTTEATTEIPATNQPKTAILEDDEDDLYFDDGDFGDLTTDDQNGGFDESIFDDETSHLYERKRVGEPPAPLPSQTADPHVDEHLEREFMLEEDASQGLKHMPSVASEYRVPAIKRGPLGEPIPNVGPARTHGGVLTEQNLEVLHNALAFAATEPATQSRFERTFSTSNRSLGQESISQTSHTGDSQPGLVSDDSRVSQGPEIMGAEDALNDHIYDDYYDDSYFDDAIVAAANAEALENDDEGFYGQEFGFYAHASGNGSSELTNGGYFGPRGVEGISRSHSSRGKFQEPSLTPITERSEWSTRNSIISVKAHGATSNPALSSPGLAQLVDMGNLDDEMSLSALMKLRRGAWGGSNGSLRSSAGSPPPHALSSSHRGSFTGASEASPSAADEGLASMIVHHDDTHPRTASPLGTAADLPRSGINGATNVDYEEEVTVTGASRLNVI